MVLRRLKTPCSVNYPPISGYYIIANEMVIRLKLYIGLGGHLYSSGSRSLTVSKNYYKLFKDGSHKIIALQVECHKS